MFGFDVDRESAFAAGRASYDKRIGEGGSIVLLILLEDCPWGEALTFRGFRAA